MKFEDALKHSTNTSAKVTLGYYPLTNRCRIDGESCKKTGCRLFEPDRKKCAHFEIQRAIHSMFHTYDIMGYTYVREPTCWLEVNTYHDYSHGDALRLGVTISALNDKSVELALKDSGLNKYFGRNPIKYFPYRYSSVHKIKDFLKILKRYQKTFAKYVKPRATCTICHKLHDSEPRYYDTPDGPKPVCYTCRDEIVGEYLVKKSG